MLGPVLCSIFISGQDRGMGCSLSQFADGTKLGKSSGVQKGRKALQRELDRLNQWAEAICMRFYMAKCWVLLLDHSNPQAALQAVGRVAGKLLVWTGPGCAGQQPT